MESPRWLAEWLYNVCNCLENLKHYKLFTCNSAHSWIPIKTLYWLPGELFPRESTLLNIQLEEQVSPSHSVILPSWMAFRIVLIFCQLSRENSLSVAWEPSQCRTKAKMRRKDLEIENCGHLNRSPPPIPGPSSTCSNHIFTGRHLAKVRIFSYSPKRCSQPTMSSMKKLKNQTSTLAVLWISHRVRKKGVPPMELSEQMMAFSSLVFGNGFTSTCMNLFFSKKCKFRRRQRKNIIHLQIKSWRSRSTWHASPFFLNFFESFQSIK